MKSNYKRLGNYIERCDEFNDGMMVTELLGISNNKYFQKSHTNTIGIDLSTYRVVRNNQFAFNRATTRNGDKISIALRDGNDCIVSPSYRIFKVKDEKILNSEYLMMWFRRPEFDRYARFKSHGSAHEFFDWEEMREVELPIPNINKQKEIVKEYNTIVNRIKLNEQLCQKLEETAQAIYKQWFVDFEFPDENGKPYKSNGGEMVFNEELEKEIPKGWCVKKLKDICTKIGSGSTPKGGKENYHAAGISLIRSLNVHDFYFSFDDLAFIDDSQANELKNVTLHENDILINITGVSVARCCVVPSSVLPARVNQHVMIIRPKKDLEINYFLLCLLCSFDSKSKLLGISQSGSTREALTKTEIEEFSMFIPDSNTLHVFQKNMFTIFSNMETLYKTNTKLTEVLNLLLSKLATLEN